MSAGIDGVRAAIPPLQVAGVCGATELTAARFSHLQAAVTNECTWPIISLRGALASGAQAILNSSMNLPDTAWGGGERLED